MERAVSLTMLQCIISLLKSFSELKDVEECFNALATYINADERTSEEISDEVLNIINVRLKNPLPLRPPRGVFIYPSGTHCIDNSMNRVRL